MMIASDGGFLSRPISKKALFLAPGERAEIIIDFGKVNKKSITLSSDNKKILEFKIAEKLEKSPDINKELVVISELPIGINPVKRVFELESMGINGTINGKYYDMNRIDEEVKRNETEIWVVRNLGGMMQTGGHPFHVHGTQFQIVSRDGKAPPPEERGFKDTVFVDVGEEVILRVVFKYPGIFMYHCHILEHEDNGMMGQFRVN
jgi:FtsP/CotA-like multicopper oxidase with cupredoxin domain